MRRVPTRLVARSRRSKVPIDSRLGRPFGSIPTNWPPPLAPQHSGRSNTEITCEGLGPSAWTSSGLLHVLRPALLKRIRRDDGPNTHPPSILSDYSVREASLTFRRSEIASFHPDLVVSQPLDWPGYQSLGSFALRFGLSLLVVEPAHDRRTRVHHEISLSDRDTQRAFGPVSLWGELMDRVPEDLLDDGGHLSGSIQGLWLSICPGTPRQQQRHSQGQPTDRRYRLCHYLVLFLRSVEHPLLGGPLKHCAMRIILVVHYARAPLRHMPEDSARINQVRDSKPPRLKCGALRWLNTKSAREVEADDAPPP